MAEPKSPIELLRPLGNCSRSGSRPAFEWRPLAGPTPGLRSPARLAVDMHWRLRVWEMPSGANVDDVMRKVPLLDEFVDRSRTEWRYPRGRSDLPVGAAYLWLVDAVDERSRVLSTSAPGLFFVEDPALPVPLAQLECCDDEQMIGSGIAGWKPAYGSPTVDEVEPGHLGIGVVSLDGSATAGDAVSRLLDPGRAFEQGQHYLVSFFARTRRRDGGVRFRVSAHDGPIASDGDHPSFSMSHVLIGESVPIRTSGWTWVVLAPWRAPRDLNRIAIAAIGGGQSDTAGRASICSGDIADVCVREVDGCDGSFLLTGSGQSISFGGSAEIDPDHEPTADATVSNLGPVADLLGPRFGDDGSDNWYTVGDECSSIGGWIPDDLEAHVPWLADGTDEGPSPELVATAIEKVLAELTDPEVAANLTPILLSAEACPDHDPAPHPRDPRRRPTDEHPIPFAGRDIVYVHGFVPNHVIARIIADDPTITAVYGALGDPLGLSDLLAVDSGGVAAVAREWPDEPTPFQDGGAFRTAAEDGYWKNHLVEFLLDDGHPNRFMVAGYNCSQRLVFAVHAVLSQIADAMTTGSGVRDPQQERGTDCFGVEYVVVTHSTGALVVQVAMAIAARTATDDKLKATYGDISAIAERAEVHISMHGAMAGSEAAQLAVVGAAALGGLVVLSDLAADTHTAGLRLFAAGLGAFSGDTTELDAFVTAWVAAGDAVTAAGLMVPEVVFNSIMVDLSPLVTKTLWATLLGSSPVPTLTLVGGHPTFGGMPGVPYVLKLVLPGLDDGVVNANSQAGSNSLVSPDVYAFIPPAARIFDMGLPLVRSSSYFIEQRRGLMAAYAAVPFLSPSGMVQPVASVPVVPRIPNVFSFIQASSEHSYTTDPGAAAGVGVEEYERSGVARNYEESLVLETPAPITSGLVAAAIVGQVVRHVRRLTVTVVLRVRVPRITLFPPSFTLDTVTLPPVTIPVWSRTYDLLGSGGAVTSAASVAVTVGPSGITPSGSWPSPDSLEVAMTAAGRPGEMRYAYDFVLPI